MEQVKAALGWLKQHHFWVLAVIVVGTAVGVWYAGSSSLAASFEDNQKKIAGEFTSQSGLRGRPFKPNDVINQRQQREIEQLAADVREVWNRLYGVQEEKVLIWPSEIGASFVRHMQGKSFGEAVRGDMRERYLNYIQKRFPELLKIVDAEELLGGSGRGGGRGGSRIVRGGGEGLGLGGARPGGRNPRDDEPEEAHLVRWLDQDVLRERMNLDQVPSALEIWVLQEDLWVYEALLQQIADTNAASGATRRNRAPIRTIEELQVGQDAAANLAEGELFVPEESTGGPGGFGGRGGFGEGGLGQGGFSGRGFGGGADSFSGRGAEGGDADLETVLLGGRYVGDDGEPVATVPADYRFGTEFKRLPVRMTLEMDFRWTPRLISELANAPLQVEIERVRFNPGETASGGRAPRSTARGPGGAANAVAFDREPSVGSVVLHGIVYIFNRPDESVLTVGDDESGAI